MSMGPIFELPNTVASHLEKASAGKGIRLELLDRSAPGEWPSLYLFCRGLGRIHGHWRVSGDVGTIWLTFPFSHAFNPFLWPFDFRLSHRIERMLVELGAHRQQYE
jgi:hypothetical protein